jgi:hypothetical protein
MTTVSRMTFFIHHFDEHVHHFDQPRLVVIYVVQSKFVKMMNTFVNMTNLRLSSGRLTNLYYICHFNQVKFFSAPDDHWKIKSRDFLNSHTL